MSDEIKNAKLEELMAQHSDLAAKLPASDGARVSVTKRSASLGDKSKGHVIVFRDSATMLRYTVSVNVSVTNPKSSGKDDETVRIASMDDLTCFSGKIDEFLSTIQNEIK